MSQNTITLKASEEVARKKREEENKSSDETKKKIQERKQLDRLGQYVTDRYRQTRKEARTTSRRDQEEHYRKCNRQEQKPQMTQKEGRKAANSSSER
ncbi:hypothetical protein HHI36_005802 [Cryptolaemus montrouzieri]|uniref:Uncharacterized protein n=1 Tax=Cryptolaemus montrouzieri TaxID=559131 RepID=A0ABD2NW42_9CUCU